MKILGLFIFFVSQAFAADQPQLVDVKTSRIGNTYTTILDFDREIVAEEYSLDFINETVQVNIPGAGVGKTKKFVSIKDSLVKSLYTYQVDEDLLRHRIILKPGNAAIGFENLVSLVKAGNKLVVKIDSAKAVAKESAFKSIIKALPPKSGAPKAAKYNREDLKSVEKLVISDQKPRRKITKATSAVESAPIAATKKELEAAVSKTVKADKRELKESEIPVLAETQKGQNSSGSVSWRLFLSLALVLIFGGAFYFGMKRYRHTGLLKNKQTSIKLLTQHYIGPKKSLAIVSVAGESILVGITDQNINHIKTLSLLDGEISEVTDEEFSTSLETANSATTNEVENDEFSIKGLKDLVSTRLQGMKDI